MVTLIRYISLIFCPLLIVPAYAQVASNAAYNPHSVRPVRKDDIMFKKTLWFRLDLRQKANQGLFAMNNEISKVLIDAVKNDLIRPFKNDSLESRMSRQEFLERLQIPLANANEQDDFFEEIDETDWGEEAAAPKTPAAPDEYLPNQLYVLELKEDLIFDKRESRMKHDILAINLVIPAEQTPTGIERVLASFSYKELVQNVFKQNDNAIWFNSQNGGAHRSLDEAFTLRLFSSRLVKYENPKDGRIVDFYGENRRSLIEADRALMKLFEYEALLWEY